jgi:hypothetical protein
MQGSEEPTSMNEIVAQEIGLPLRFPDPRTESYARAEEFRRLSSGERLQEIASLMAAGYQMVQLSPRRDAIVRRWEEEEANWQRIQTELFEHHGA